MDLRGSGAGLFEMRNRSCMRVASVLGKELDKELALNSVATAVRSLASARAERVIGAEILVWETTVSAGTSAD